MADEDFHEIQLNGKQLVFLFMAGTVAAGVIFLCGLMVGRNLHVPHLEAAAATPDGTRVDPTPPPEQPLPPARTPLQPTRPARRSSRSPRHRPRRPAARQSVPARR